MKSLLATVLLATLVLTFADFDVRRKALENPDLYQGDILGVDPEDRNVIPFREMRWPNAEVFIELHSSLYPIAHLIFSAMREIQKHTCVRFAFTTGDEPEVANYIRIYKGQGCNSYVGMQGGQQLLSLGNGCEYKGTILHELGHALGLYHEQNRSDRDKYIKIFWKNIDKKYWNEFALLPPHGNILYTDFDYNSIMMYGNYAFSKDGRSMTMKTYAGIKLVDAYDKETLSRSDIYKINKMYNCYKS